VIGRFVGLEAEERRKEYRTLLLMLMLLLLRLHSLVVGSGSPLVPVRI